MSFRSTTIAKLATVKSGGGAPQDPAAFSQDGHPFVRAGSLSKLLNGGRECDLEHLNPDVARAHRLQLFPTGTVLFAKSGMSSTKGYIYALQKPAYVVNHLAALIPHDTRDSRFLQRALERFSPTSLIKDQAYPSIRLGDIENFEILAPDAIEERMRIAAILDKADALRRKRRQALDLLDSLTQSIFLEMFGDPIQNNYAWPTIAAGDLCRRLTVGIVVRPASYYRSSGIPAIRSINIRENDFEMNDVVFVSADDNEGVLSKSRIFQGDIVIVRTGQPGKAAVVPMELDGANAIDILIASPNPAIIHPHYLCDLLNSSAGKALALHGKRGQIQQHLNVGTLKSALLPVPPLTLQAEYMKRKVALNELKSAARASLASTDSLFTSLQSRAFSGQL